MGKRPESLRPGIATVLALVVCAAHASSPAGRATLAGDAPALDSQAIRLTLERGQVSLDARAAPLVDVLQALGAQAGFEVVIDGDPQVVVTDSFVGLRPDEAVKRLVGDVSMVMTHAPDDGGESARALAQVRVYAAAGNGSPAAAPSPTSDIGSEPHPPRVEALADVLSDNEDVRARKRAAAALRSLAHPQAAEALSIGLDDADPSVRARAVRGLREMMGDDAAPLLSDVTTRDASPAVRRIAVYLLGEMDHLAARSALEAARFDPDRSVRETAAEALAAWPRARTDAD